jgi:hypothetical protein
MMRDGNDRLGEAESSNGSNGRDDLHDGSAMLKGE